MANENRFIHAARLLFSYEYSICKAAHRNWIATEKLRRTLSMKKIFDVEDGEAERQLRQLMRQVK